MVGKGGEDCDNEKDESVCDSYATSVSTAVLD